MKIIKTTLLLGAIILSTFGFGQNNDKVKFNVYEPGFYQNFILKDVRNVKAKTTETKKDKRFAMLIHLVKACGQNAENAIKYNRINNFR